MTPGDFLRSVWPGEGIYCLATPFTIPGTATKVYAHKTFDKITDAVSFVLQKRGANDLFFAVHTLKEKCVWNPEKVNRKTGEVGANEVRVQRNMRAAKCFFFDLDVGNSPHKYASQRDAVADLRRFCQVTQLPVPLVTSSGGGLHVYWLVGEELESEEWRLHAAKLRQLARHHGLKADPARTTDTASVLRVAGTFNWKDRSAPKEVRALKTGTSTPTGVFIKLVDDAVIRAGVTVVPPPVFDATALGSNITREFDGPPVSMKAVYDACKQMARLVNLQGNVSEPEWYHGIIGVGRFTKDGHRRVHQMSRGFPGYNEADTTAKLQQHEARRDPQGNPLGPTGCAKLAEVSGAGDELCIGCPFLGKVHGPIGAARYKDPAPAPVVAQLVGSTTVTVEIPDPPKPFTRLKGGGISIFAKDASGEEVHTQIYDYDLYPIRRLANTVAGTEQQVWFVQLPRNEAKEFLLDADALYDSRKFVVAIANQGIYPNKGHISHLQEYMVAYIAQLQKLTEADAQCNHLGWAEDHTRFILPDKILANDGTAKPAQLSVGAQRASAQVHKKGDLLKQVELLKFYDRAAYLPNQFYILGSLAAPIFFATGHHGVILNASGDAGASKSTSLYTAASLWGQPELYPINGTNNGATVRGRNERVTVLANLPICVDEITHMPIKDAVDLAMSVTQPGHRIRLGTDGVERASLESYKATIMLATANSSLHNMLSTDNTAGTAGSMRVFEINFKRQHVHKKHEADDYWHLLKENFGHIGELFVTNVMGRLEAVKARVRQVMREIDLAAGIQPSERFWSATVAAVIVAGEIAKEMGLLTYDPQALRKWALEVQIPYMRGVVQEEYSDPLTVLSDYLEQINGNIIVMSKAQQGNLYAQHVPKGPLLAHYDGHEKLLIVLKKGFKDYCVRTGANSLKILDELSQPRDGARIICNKHARRTLGAGTEYAKAQTWCFVINMSHPEVTGAIDLEVLAGGNTGGDQVRDKKPDLRAVT